MHVGAGVVKLQQSTKWVIFWDTVYIEGVAYHFGRH